MLRWILKVVAFILALFQEQKDINPNKQEPEKKEEDDYADQAKVYQERWEQARKEKLQK